MIKFHIFNEDLIDLQLVDAWYAKQQYLRSDLRCEINLDTNADLDPAHVNVALGYIFNQNFIDQRHRYDLIFLGNGGEPIEVADQQLKDLLQEHNVYLICNGLLMPGHEIYEKTLWFPHNLMLCLNFWTRHFYPQYFEIQQLKKSIRKNEIAAINGSNRSNRNYFFTLLRDKIPDLTFPESNLFSGVKKLKDCQWESEQDQIFRDYVNELYKDVRSEESDTYNENGVPMGLNAKFGLALPGYHLMPIYYENSVIVFPESNWVNDQLCLTEKACKCFISGSLPMPVAGSNVNFLYNSVGFYTAWNLLPAELQEFDSESDHQRRYKGLVEAIDWLWNNRDVTNGSQFHDMVLHNQQLFLRNSPMIDYTDRFDRIIKTQVDIKKNLS